MKKFSKTKISLKKSRKNVCCFEGLYYLCNPEPATPVFIDSNIKNLTFWYSRYDPDSS